MIDLKNVSKTFTLHNQNSAVIDVISNVSLRVEPGECVALTGDSGAGKSTLMRMIYGNYLTQAGSIRIGGVDIVQAEPREVIALRREVLGYVSQFLRVVPRVPTLDVVADPLRALGVPLEAAQLRARTLLAQLNIPERLWSLSPTTFSGGEQQRVNIARGFAHEYPAMLLDEPTASLDATNREVVLSLIEEAKARGAAIIGIFHDAAARERVCDRAFDVSAFSPPAPGSRAVARHAKAPAA
ncbi:MAG: phosphonate C-P lyase system protein PhnL [Pseudomonadota bacterium]